jgi:hypothetical protein
VATGIGIHSQVREWRVRRARGALAVMEADGDPIPNARSLEELKQDTEFVDDSSDAVVAFVVPQGDQVTTLQSVSQVAEQSEIRDQYSVKLDPGCRYAHSGSTC